MIYNISQPNTTLDSIDLIHPYVFTFNGLILLFTIVIILTIILVIGIKKLT